MRKRSRKTWFPKRISDNIPPQTKILNIVIPILMHYYHFSFERIVKMYFVAPIRPAAASCIKPLANCIYSLVNQWKETVRNDVGFATVYPVIYCRKFMTLSKQTSGCICKCIRMTNACLKSVIGYEFMTKSPWLSSRCLWKELYKHLCFRSNPLYVYNVCILYIICIYWIQYV